MIFTLSIPYDAYFSCTFWLSALKNLVFLDTSLVSDEHRYSFVAADPWQILTSKNGMVCIDDNPVEGCPWAVLKEELEKHTLPLLPYLPPFQGGIAGYFGYELAHHLEKFSYPAQDDMMFPDLMIGFYDCVAAFDHHLKEAWIFSSGLPFQEENRDERSRERAFWLRDCLLTSPLPAISPSVYPFSTEIECNLTQPEYEEKIKTILTYIAEGDIYQANMSRRFQASLPPTLHPLDLFCGLRFKNPAPFSAYLNFKEVQLACASPERFIKLYNTQVETKPIKGTRPRSPDPAHDKQLAQELLASEKDRAENLMIVDLLRNDLSRVCLPHTVQTPKLLQLESFSTVHHLVSTVVGTLAPSLTALDALKAAFPGGSITGVPKIRAMDIISDLEPTYRGPYCGSVGYIGFNGTMDTNIVIRTFAIKDDKITFQAGGGIVADSDPRDEYDETTTKAKALYNLLREGCPIK